MCTGLFLEVKQLEHEVDLQPPSSTKVMNKWSYTSASSICFHGVDRDNLKLHCRCVLPFSTDVKLSLCAI